MRELQKGIADRSIVVGTDGSPQADRAVEWAAVEAARRRRGLHIVSSMRLWDSGPLFGPEPCHVDALTEAGQAILTDAVNLAAKAAPEVTVTTELVSEPPAVALRDRADGASEVVVGHRGHGGFTSLLLGSTSLNLAGHTPCPVVVVRGESTDDRHEVLVGIDPHDAPDAILEYTFETAALRGSWVRAVYAWNVQSTLFTDDYPKAVRRALTGAQDQLAKAMAPWRARFPGIRVIEEAAPGHAVEELVERSCNADLLVVGRHCHGRGPHLGSVGHGVIHHADCPVAVLAS